MGFYDYRCAFTGLSLLGQRCDVVLLRSEARRMPLWGTVTGAYNRAGTIDDPPMAGPQFAHLTAALARGAADGSIVERGDPPEPGEPFFERFEKNRHVMTLGGDRVVLTLIHHRIVEFIVREAPDVEDLSDEALFAKVFARSPAIAPYAPDLALGRGLRRLAALQHWLGARPFPLLGEPEQHGEAEAMRSIRDAKKRAPALREAIEWAETEDYRSFFRR